MITPLASYVALMRTNKHPALSNNKSRAQLQDVTTEEFCDT